MKKSITCFVKILLAITSLILEIICINNAWADEVDVVNEINKINENIPEIYIRAVNPGYTVDGKTNVGEMIEIARKNSDTPFSLAGATVGYTNSSGKYYLLFEFPENSWMTGETILLRLASSPDSELATINYTKTLAMKASVALEINGEVVDRACWTGEDGCEREFKSASPTTLVRNLETGEFEHLEIYKPEYHKDAYMVEEQVGEDESALPSQCKGLEFSEILSYYDTSRSEQFIELHNTKSEQILLDGCKIKYKNKSYALKGIVKADGYFVYPPTEFNLTKNPTNSNILELVDTNGQIIDKLVYLNGQRRGTSYALVGYDKKGEEIWKVTYAPTPGEPNNYQEFKTCEAGKVINKETGNCVKVAEIKTKVCADGQYLNILTGRCKKIVTAAEKKCKEGYYLNPETNRCRKIKENTGANYALVPESYEEKSSFIALYAVLGVAIVGLVYLIFEFRKEIRELFCKVFRRSR